VQKSKQIKTVKLAKNVKITQEQLSMQQPQAALPSDVLRHLLKITLFVFH